MKVTTRVMEPGEMPREKFLHRGAAACSNADLLAILMRTGTTGEGVLDLAERILADCDGSLANLHRLPLEQLTQYKGLGPTKAMIIKAAAELTQRRLVENMGERKRLKSSRDLFQYFEYKLGLSSLCHEEMHALYMSRNLTAIRTEMIGRGGLADTPVDVRLILKGALLNNASYLALCHNHPSGNIATSRQDDEVTRMVGDACRMMGIGMIDHIVISGPNEYYSYSDAGKLY